MTTSSPFPPYPGAGLSRADVVAYLVELNQQGWSVFDAGNDWFVVRMGVDAHGADRLARIGPRSDGWEVSCNGFLGQWQLCGRPSSLAELRKAMSQAAAFLDVAGWPESRPSSVRLVEAEPASNVHKISTLVGSATVEAVFDPYLDNIALQSLGDIVSFGGSVASNIRLLTSPRLTTGSTPRLTHSFAQNWFSEHGCTNGEVRLMASPKEHRRFLLLSGGTSLILGPSLNSLAKNEAASVESDVEDRSFFDSAWTVAQPFA